MILDHFDPSQGCTEGGDPLGRRNLNIFIKITKIGPQVSISSIYIVLQSPLTPKTCKIQIFKKQFDSFQPIVIGLGPRTVGFLHKMSGFCAFSHHITFA